LCGIGFETTNISRPRRWEAMTQASKFIRWLLRSLVALVVVAITAFAVWRVNLAHDVNTKLQAIRAAGLPTNGTEANTYYTAVPDDENVALKMADAFASMANYNDRRSNEVISIKFPQRKDTLTPEQLELVAGYCAMNSNALAQAMEAIKLPRYRYPMDLSWGAATLMPHLAKLKQMSRIAEFQTIVDAKNSAADISTIIGMARTLDTEPTIISKLVRIAMLNMAEIALERRLNAGGLDEVELNHLSQLFAEAAKTNQMSNGLIGERAAFMRYFRMSFAEIKKLANDSEENLSEQGRPPIPGAQPFIFKLTGFFERDLRFYLQGMETNISLASTFPKNISMITNVEEQISQTSRRNYYILSSMLLPALGNTIIKEANGLAQVRTAQAALAVERFRLVHGQLPENLNELVPQFLSAVPVDPFDGQPLRYHRLGKGYVIYSIGRDGLDDGGREKPADWKSSDKTSYDITFTVER
jgi:type II secretory pathway pseudopilin PulG